MSKQARWWALITSCRPSFHTRRKRCSSILVWKSNATGKTRCSNHDTSALRQSNRSSKVTCRPHTWRNLLCLMTAVVIWTRRSNASGASSNLHQSLSRSSIHQSRIISAYPRSSKAPALSSISGPFRSILQVLFTPIGRQARSTKHNTLMRWS